MSYIMFKVHTFSAYNSLIAKTVLKHYRALML